VPLTFDDPLLECACELLDLTPGLIRNALEVQLQSRGVRTSNRHLRRQLAGLVARARQRAAWGA
jgi:hypothetical protein